jgi:hypothetical protein
VPLRDISEFQAWIDREEPSRAALSVARTFVAELSDRPWRAPSVPIAELSKQPEYEVRTAALEVQGERDVVVWWLHDYATGDVDLIAISNR